MAKYRRLSRGKRRTSRRRMSRRRRPSIRRKTRISTVRTSNVIADRTFCRLKYCELISMSYGALGVPVPYQFRINSIFDPNKSGVGHQPRGHDQWQTFYNRYRVRGMYYKITLWNTSTTEFASAAIQCRPNVTTEGDVELLIENPETKGWRHLEQSGSGRNMCIFKGYADVCKLRGVTRGRLKYESDYQALFGNNPIIEPCLTVYLWNPNFGNAVTINARVELIYNCEFFDRHLLNKS